MEEGEGRWSRGRGGGIRGGGRSEGSCGEESLRRARGSVFTLHSEARQKEF